MPFEHDAGTLTITKDADVTSVAHGGTITYTLEVSYDSLDGARADSVTVTDPGCDAAPAPSLVAGFNVGDADPDGYLDDGETWTYTCSFVTGGHADAETAVTNTAFANGTDFDGDALVEDASNETSVPFEHDAGTLTITKDADVTSVAHGGTITYTLEVSYDSTRRRACRLGDRH